MEKDLRQAAGDGDFTTLTRLVEQGVNLEALDRVSGAPPAAPSPMHTLALRPRRPPPLLPRPHRRR